jgi:hypothetical protein
MGRLRLPTVRGLAYPGLEKRETWGTHICLTHISLMMDERLSHPCAE